MMFDLARCVFYINLMGFFLAQAKNFQKGETIPFPLEIELTALKYMMQDIKSGKKTKTFPYNV